MAIGIEIGPIQRHDDLASGAKDIRHPVRKQLPDVEPGMAQESVHLLDGVLGVQPARLGQARANRVNGQRDGVDDADRGVRDRTGPAWHADPRQPSSRSAGQRV